MLVAIFFLAICSSTAFATDYTVTRTTDTNDGVCNADCSLREAIVAANANAGSDRIILGAAQTYVLSLGPADPPGALIAGSGDLDITEALVIDGNGSVVDAALIDRVFDIQGSFTVTINGLTIRNGLAAGFLSLGGGLYIRAATVVLNNCVVSGNSTAIESGSRDDGGGVAVIGSYNPVTATATLATLTLNNSTVSANSGSNGGGIVCVLCALTASNSVLQTNGAVGDGGGVDVLGHSSTLAMTSSTLLGNTATGAVGRGGGLAVPFGSSVSTLTRSRIASNTGTLAGAIFNNVGAITATNNWWGCSYGPGTGGAGCAGTPNEISGLATTTPYLVLRGSAAPSAVTVGGSSTMTADLTFNSSSVDTSAGGMVRDGTIAAFSGTLGTFATPTAPTVSGKASDIYTAGGSPGTASVSATVDSQTVSASIPIAGIAPVITAHPSDRLAVPGSNVTFTVAASGNPAPTYQWQVSTNGGVSWTNLADSLPYSGVTTATLTVSGVTTGLSGNRYRAIASNSAGTATSNPATLTIDTSADDRTVLGLGPYSTDGGWVASRKGAAGALGPATWLHLPWPAYNATGGGLRVAAGDVDGDGLDEIVVGLGPGGGGWIAIFDDAAHGYAFIKWIRLMWSDYNTANGEVWPAVGDLDGDGRAEIVAGTGPGGQGWFEIFDDATTDFAHSAWRQIAWPAYTAMATAVVHPAVGNVDGVGASDILIGMGQGSNGWVEVVNGAASGYDHQTWCQVNWMSYDGSNGTTFPAAGDLDGDGRAEVVLGLGNGGGGYLEVLDDAAGGFAHLAWLRTSWTVFNTTGSGETHPAVGNVDGDARAEIVIGLDVVSGEGGWFETLDDAVAGFVSLGWRNAGWEAFRISGGALFPATGRFK